MPYKFLKPQITNVWKATAESVLMELGKIWMALILLLSVVILVYPPVVVFLFFIPLFCLPLIFFTQIRKRATFWKQFAELNGWQYKNFTPEEVNEWQHIIFAWLTATVFRSIDQKKELGIM